MTPHYTDDAVTLYHGDCLDVLAELPDGSVNCCVTSPPYFGLRDYGVEGQHGAESSPAEYVETMRATFAQVRRVLADDGTLWLNLGDSYAGSWGAQGKSPQGLHSKIIEAGGATDKVTRTGAIGPGMPPAKNLLGIPWRVAFALQDDGWILRSDIIWAKPNPMPSSVTDRPTNAHEHLFLFAKNRRYFYDADSIAEQATGQSSGNGYARPHSISQGLGQDGKYEGRTQLRRALVIAKDKGLTAEHLAAIRAVGMNDAGKAVVTQSGAGKNTARVQALADEAKAALGGYYREFLTGATRNARSVWTIPTEVFPHAHYATMPHELARRCIAAGCTPGGTVLDPYSGSGTTGAAAGHLGRKYIGIDLDADALDLSLRTRLAQTALLDDESSA